MINKLYVFRYDENNKYLVLDDCEIMDECIFEVLSQYIHNPEHLIEDAWGNVEIIKNNIAQEIKEYLELGYVFYD